jgi:hypothetical protein
MINAFLAHEKLSEQEDMLKQNALSLNEAVQNLSKERNEMVQKLQAKEQELLKVTGALENQLSIIEHLAVKMGLEPVEAQQEQESQDVEQVQVSE